MNTTAQAPPDLSSGAVPARRRAANVAATVAFTAALTVAALPLGLVVYEVVSKGSSVMSWEFLTADIQNVATAEGGGIAPAVVGTLLTTGLAALMAIPLGILGAIYLNEYGKKSPLANFIRVMADVMTGVPSIVMGLFIFIVWVLVTGSLSAFGGALALGCLMLPIVLRSSEEMLRLVPDELRQASAALGARKWKTVTTVVLPSSISGITSGSLLAVARAAGETAPLIVTIGVTTRMNWDAFNGGNTALSTQIFANASEPYQPAIDRAWGAALTLITIVLVFTVVSRFISSRFAVKER